MNRLTSFIIAAIMSFTCAGVNGQGGALAAEQWAVFETSFTSERKYDNPFLDVQVDVVFRSGSQQWLVPAFWAGGDKWTVRFAPPVQGDYTFQVKCSDPANQMVNGASQALHVTAYTGDNPLPKHGFLRVAADKRHFEHADGTPFFWLGDTWWKNLCKRMTWEGFQELTADRKAKGFSVVQIVCGPYPDEGFFEARWENEGGLPYESIKFDRVNPRYFDYADRRLKHLVDAGIAPAIVGAWGRGDCDSMQAIGAAGLKRHWRYLVARYSAYPVFWILAGEIPEETKWGQGPWAEVATYLRGIDPYHRLLTCHTGQGRRGAKGDSNVIDYDMVGGNHDERVAVESQTLAIITTAYAKDPPMPVLVGETCYEGHMQQGFGDVQRRMFWGNMLSGAAGHTYGAAGIWHASVEGDPGCASAAFGGSKVYDWTTWKEGMVYPGATQLGLGKKLLEKYPWSRFEPHPEWVEEGCFAAGIPGEVRIIYLPRRNIYNWDGPAVKNLEPDVDWHVYYFDPAAGRTFDQGRIKASAKADDKTAKPVEFKKNVPSPQDWVLVFERMKEPIQLHPDNPHYLLWRGKPTVLITSGEHYGAVMNSPFDYVAYLDELQSAGLNLTRTFSGVYCEAVGDFNIKDNTLAPGPGNLLCPFARSNTPGYANGGNKFDLSKWDEAYFTRLKDFVAQAGKRGVVVEFTFFCPYYYASQWNLSPFNPRNNVNNMDIGAGILHHPALLEVQLALVRKVVAELKDADNLYYEVSNEAYGEQGPGPWQQKIAAAIVEAEKAFPRKHLLAQNTVPVYDSVHPAVSIFNFHPGAHDVSVSKNYGLNKLTGLDETSPTGNPLGAATTAFDYRRWGWTHLLDGGAIYNNLDYSFTVEHPRGAYQPWDKRPGGEMAAMRKQLRILKNFIEGFNFVGMKPDATLVKGGVPDGGAVHVLAKVGEEYALYLHGGTKAVLSLDLPAGRYRAEWVNTLHGTVDKVEDVTHSGGLLALSSPEYKDDVALRVKGIKP